MKDYRLWAIFHVGGRNPKKCTCNDCADKSFWDKEQSPDECAKTTEFEVGFS